MNGDKRGKKLLTVCVCILVSVVFLMTSFVQKKTWKNEKDISKKTENQIKGSEETETGVEAELEAELEAEPEPELYQEGEIITVYFTNTEQIDEKGALPYKELESLVEQTQKFLRDKDIQITELQVINDSLRKEEAKTYFWCKAGEAVLEIGYDRETDEFEFNFKEGGE